MEFKFIIEIFKKRVAFVTCHLSVYLAQIVVRLPLNLVVVWKVGIGPWAMLPENYDPPLCKWLYFFPRAFVLYTKQIDNFCVHTNTNNGAQHCPRFFCTIFYGV